MGVNGISDEIPMLIERVNRAWEEYAAMQYPHMEYTGLSLKMTGPDPGKEIGRSLGGLVKTVVTGELVRESFRAYYLLYLKPVLTSAVYAFAGNGRGRNQLKTFSILYSIK